MISLRHTVVIALMIVTTPALHAGGGQWTFLPGSQHSLLLLANPEEPRTGVRFEPGTSNLRLDVGASMTLLEYAPSPRDRFLLGADLFAYALTTNNSGLRLQVDALDGFFGGHFLYSTRFSSAQLSLRLRILHRSAHFVDGHIDPSTGDWANNKAPIPYTRDFGEFVAALDLKTAPGTVRIYSGLSYSTLVRPEQIERFAGLFGMEYRTVDSVFVLFERPFNLYAAYNLSLTGIPAYHGANSAEAGIRFGGWLESGVMLLVAYHSGPEIYGQYFDIRREYWQVGFAFDLR